jgi:hypothetical protein
VLRTGRKPHRGELPKMADLLPKDSDGKLLGKKVEIEYDVVDLPAWNFGDLVGGPMLRAVLGVLKKMLEGHEDEYPEAMLPLCEISDEAQLIELTKEILDFVTKAMAAHNCRVDEEMLSRALKPIFKDKEQEMIKTIFDEKYEAGVAEGFEKGEVIGFEKGEAKERDLWATDKIETLLQILTNRLSDVPPTIGDKLHTINDIDVLSLLTKVALNCRSLAEFEQALNK